MDVNKNVSKDSKQFTITLNHQNKIYLINLLEYKSPIFSKLKEAIINLTKIQDLDSYIIKYLDDENDYIIISNQSDFDQALLLSEKINTNNLSITLHKRNDNISQSISFIPSKFDNTLTLSNNRKEDKYLQHNTIEIKELAFKNMQSYTTITKNVEQSCLSNNISHDFSPLSKLREEKKQESDVSNEYQNLMLKINDQNKDIKDFNSFNSFLSFISLF